MNENPLLLFNEDRAAARAAVDPMAELCVMATVNAEGHPQARTLVLRSVDDSLILYLNATSPKWSEIEASVAIQTCWPSTGVQYRMRVATSLLPQKRVAERWQYRPEPPKQLDWLYQHWSQSSDIGSRAALLEALEQAKPSMPGAMPDTAKGIVLHPVEIERLNLNHESGVHDRRRYRKIDTLWHHTTLVP